MTNEVKMIWFLRIYGPCSVAKLIQVSGWSRNSVCGALRRVRKRSIARRCGKAKYNLTPYGFMELNKIKKLSETPLLDAEP